MLVDVQASGLCHTDLLFATHDIVPTPRCSATRLRGSWLQSAPTSRNSVSAITSSGLSRSRAAGALDASPAVPSSASIRSRHCDGPDDAPRLSRGGLACSRAWGWAASPNGRSSTRTSSRVVPKEMPFAQAALLGCGVVTGAGAVLNTANVNAGDTVVIFGAGGVGLNAVSGARIAGASRIVVIDIQPKRLEAARRFGATDVIDSTKTKPVEAVRDLLPGGADHVFDFVGLKAVAKQGLAMLGVGGGLYLVGVVEARGRHRV